VATFFSCDGCGVSVTDPIKVGHVLRREYCEDCARDANIFLEAEERLRRETVERFADERAALVARCSADGFKLPDTP